MFVLKGYHPLDGEIHNEFTDNERELAIAVGQRWNKRKWYPKLLHKSYDGQFKWLTHLLNIKKVAA